jgi:hypothetical protein
MLWKELRSRKGAIVNEVTAPTRKDKMASRTAATGLDRPAGIVIYDDDEKDESLIV